MKLENNWRKIPKTSESRFENTLSQPLKTFQVFNNPDVITEAWYPVLPSYKLKKNNSGSFKIGAQRVVLFRGDDNQVRALDAFCPHMGADLSRGKVIKNEIQCYFHRWKFNSLGELTDIPCNNSKLPKIKTTSYPVEEKYGFIWIYSGLVAPYPVPQPPGLENESVEGRFVLKTKLFVHHHVLMASAIDLQHFASVHELHADFEHEVSEKNESVYQWNVIGNLGQKGWRNGWARKILGPRFSYRALFAGGSIVCLTYGDSQKFLSWTLPTFHVLWGCLPQADGLSEAFIFVIQKKQKGLTSKIKSILSYYFTLLLLAWLKDDDIQAFPRMRFQAQNLMAGDSSVARFIQITEKLKRSFWSFKN